MSGLVGLNIWIDKGKTGPNVAPMVNYLVNTARVYDRVVIQRVVGGEYSMDFKIPIVPTRIMAIKVSQKIRVMLHGVPERDV